MIGGRLHGGPLYLLGLSTSPAMIAPNTTNPKSNNIVNLLSCCQKTIQLCSFISG